MKKVLTIIISLVTIIFVFSSCNDNNPVVYDNVPVAPQGVYSVTGDNAVYIFWNGIYENDVAGYIVYRSLEPNNNFVEIGRVDADSNPNLDLLIYEFDDNTAKNGVTYYYAVSAYDVAGQESELSAENVFDTPRPDGQITLFDYQVDSTLSGYNFAAQATVNYNSPVADVYIDRVGGVFYLNVTDTLTDIQDMGYTSSFDDISYAPQDGWSENGWSEIIVGHTYVIWTRDSHYAKMRVLSINTNSVTFRWAYQTDQDNPELVSPSTIVIRPSHNPNYLNKNILLNNNK
ncbi:MAG: hypothetical protein GXO93_00710 [FCB group bacterium]|nr:hypothetical protein [FCB group bacterium]